MSNNIFVSFVAPAYNVSKYLDDFFSSFIGLDRDKYELVFVDDKSPEDTSKFVAKYKEEVNIKYIQNKINLGKGFARNAGVENISDKSTHVMYVDPDDKLDDISFLNEIKPREIKWFNYTGFTKTKKYYRDQSNNFGKSLFTNTIWGIAIPVNIAKEFPFEANYYEDMYVNRELVTKYKDEIAFSRTSAIMYRHRRSGATASPTNSMKFKQFISEMLKIETLGANTTRFNMQEIYQYYWMWKKYLKDLPPKDLPDAKLRYKIAFRITGSLIRFLRIGNLVYGIKRNGFE